MMDKRYVITFDCGTQSTRAMLFDDRGTLVGKAKVAFEPYRSPAPGLAEQDAEFYFDKLCEASNALKAEYPAEFARAEAVSLTTIRDTCVQLDVSGKPVRPVIVWMDRRLADCKKPLPLYLRAALALMGISRTAQSVREQAKCNWLMEHEPDGWARTHKYTMISGYYTYMLTGEYTDSTASQIGHLPFESRRRRWYPKRSPLRNLIDIPEEKMMALVDAGGTLGHITETAAALTGLKAGLPLIAAGSDKGCETLGTGCIDESMASLSFGTAATLQLTTKNYVEPKKFLPAYAAVVKGWYNPEVQVYSGYWMLNWYKNQFASHEEEEAKKIGIPVEEYLNRLVADMEPGCGGLTVLPYWNPMLHLPESRGSVTGFTDAHTKLHLYRAIVEGIGFELCSWLHILQRRTGVTVKKLTVSGGGSTSDVICQLTADLFGLPVYRAQTYETSGLGAAISAFVGLNRFDSYADAVKGMVAHQPPFVPNPRKAVLYANILKNRYAPLYKSLRPHYKKMSEDPHR